MIQKQLKNAILDVAVKHFGATNKPFSAYDITRQLRSDVNAKLYEIAEFVGVASQYGQEISHEKVRSVIVELYDTHFLDRKNNGTYWTYSVSVSADDPAVIGHPSYLKLVDAIDALTATTNGIRPSSRLVEDLKLTDIDLAELEVVIEDDFFDSKQGAEPFSGNLNPPITTVGELHKYILQKLVKSTIQAAATQAPSLQPNPTVALDAGKTALFNYIQRRINSGVEPKLKNAQKFYNETYPGISIQRLADIVRGDFGYAITGDSNTPFNQWSIGIKLTSKAKK